MTIHDNICDNIWLIYTYMTICMCIYICVCVTIYLYIYIYENVTTYDTIWQCDVLRCYLFYHATHTHTKKNGTTSSSFKISVVTVAWRSKSMWWTRVRVPQWLPSAACAQHFFAASKAGVAVICISPHRRNQWTNSWRHPQRQKRPAACTWWSIEVSTLPRESQYGFVWK